MRLITSACGTFGAFWIWRDAGFESAISSEPALHQPFQLKLIFFVPVDGWSLVAAARCRVTGDDGRSSLDRTDHGPLPGAKPTPPSGHSRLPDFDYRYF